MVGETSPAGSLPRRELRALDQPLVKGVAQRITHGFDELLSEPASSVSVAAMMPSWP
jgi:hypothetical protein